MNYINSFSFFFFFFHSVYIIFALAPEAALVKRGRPWGDETCYKRKAKVQRKFRLPSRAQDNSCASQGGTRIIWIFTDAFSSQSAYQRFSPFSGSTWRKPTISGSERIGGRRQRKAETQYGYHDSPYRPHFGYLSHTKETVWAPLLFRTQSQVTSQSVFTVPLKSEPGSGFWEEQPWPRICWEPYRDTSQKRLPNKDQEVL